jgi:ankyrin repeat protein
MRLLYVNVDGSLTLTTFVGNQIPSYAILSHTWEANNQEVTFQDVEKGLGSSKPGYRKIQFCGAQAQKDDLEYFWVDSCCIDKSNSTELQEAINSMFRWYQNAAKCYVYLSDVSAIGCTAIQWQSAFVQSKWFTRGWTLQELLAPRSVEFFSHNGERLGNKESLEQHIHNATGIAVQALQRGSLSQFPVDERMSWAAKRETTIEEDQIYCLLGIFNIYLPLIYGEGKSHAFHRLQDEIDRRSSLNTQGSAATNAARKILTLKEIRPESADRKQRVDSFLQLLYGKACLYEDSKNRNRERITGTCDWFTNHELFKKWNSPVESQLESSNLLFVTADPGCGKSVLCRYLIDQILPKDTRMICYFFFKDDFEDQKSSLQALCTMLHQLLSWNRHLLSDVILEKHGAHGEKFVESFSDLWSTFINAASQQETVCVIDALDECHELERSQLIEAITVYQRSKRSQKIKFLVTSRPYEHIRRQFDRRVGSQMHSIHLQGDHGPTADEIVREIQLVMDSRIEETADLFCLDSDERKLLRRQLESVPNRTYLWITLVFDGMMDSKLGIDQSDILDLTQRLPQSVDDAYEKILNKNSELEKLRRRALHIILGAKRPMSLVEMSTALAFKDLDGQPSCSYSANKVIPMNRIRAYLRDLCGLFVTTVDDKVYLLHQTAREFLIRNSTLNASETLTASNRIKSQKDNWKNSMNLEESNSILAKISISYLHLDVAKENSALLEYSAIYWSDHYHQSDNDCQVAIARETRDICQPAELRTKWAEIHNRHNRIPVIGSSSCLAAALGLDKVMEMILRDEVLCDLESRDSSYDRSPLSWASRNGHEAVVKLLLKAGAGTDSKDSLYGRTPLSWAASNGYEGVVKLLLGTKADVDLESRDTLRSRTPLSRAAESGHKAVVRLLLDAGAEIDSKSSTYGRTPLSWAAGSGQEAVVKLLLEAGADVNLKNSIYGRSPLSWAAGSGHEAVVKLLLEAGAHVDSKNSSDGRTPLCLAAQSGHEVVIKLLLEAGADVNIKDLFHGRTPLSWATESGHEAVINLLQSPNVA